MSSDYNQQLTDAMYQRNYSQLSSVFFQKKFEIALNPELSYFLGLHFLEMKDSKTAENLFAFGWKKAPDLIAKMCAEKLIEITSESEKLAIIEKFMSMYPADYTGKVHLARLYYKNQDYQKVLTLIGLPNIRTFEAPPQILNTDTPERQKQIAAQLSAENEFAKLRILCLVQLNNPAFIMYIIPWITYWEITQAHRDFFNDWLSLPNRSELVVRYGNKLSQALYLLQMRLAVYNRDYAVAKGYADKLQLNPTLYPPSLFSDYCRAQFYSYKHSDQFMKELLSFIVATKDPYIQFAANFYVGRILGREKRYAESLEYFRASMTSAPNPENYDNALWYYFDISNKISVEAVIAALYSFGKTINNFDYFQDFFSSLSLSLLNEKKWNDYVRIYETMTTFSGGTPIVQFAYITARLLEEGLVKNPSKGIPVQQVITNAYKQAYSGDHSSLYYRVLAAKKLNIPIEEVSKSFYMRTPNYQFVQNKELELLLLGFAQYGFPEKVFSTFITDYHSISLPLALQLSNLVYAQSATNARLYSDAIRIISFATARVEVPLTKEVLQALYPRPFYSEINTATKRFNISEYIFYGLVRTESYFDKDISSHAGAVGLAQLMPSTAADVARRLKITEYNLLDAQTNTLFGAYYYSEMVQRMNNSPLLALFSYNGGPTRVRSWVKAHNDLPIDLFLEIIPIFETRDYGRKVLAASILYGYLYYDTASHDIIAEVMK